MAEAEAHDKQEIEKRRAEIRALEQTLAERHAEIEELQKLAEDVRNQGYQIRTRVERIRSWAVAAGREAEWNALVEAIGAPPDEPPEPPEPPDPMLGPAAGNA